MNGLTLTLSRRERRSCHGLACWLLLWAAVALCVPGAAAAVERTKVYRHGPIVMGGYETKSTVGWVPSPSVDGSLVAMHATLVDANGRRVPQTQVMLHHLVFVNYGRFHGDRRSPYCGDRPREPFYGTAEEDQALRLPTGYGYRVRSGDRWLVRYMLMNHRSPTRRVYIRYRVTTTAAQRTPVTPYWVSVACNRDRIYNVEGGGPPGTEEVRSIDWRVPKTGRIVALAGHLHGGGKRVNVVEPGCGDRVLGSSTAQYGLPRDPLYRMSPMLHEPSPRSVAVVMTRTGWPVRAGQILRIDSTYDRARPHAKVMGIAHLYIAEDGDSPTPCSSLPADITEHREPFPGAPGLAEPPVVRQNLSRRDATGRARAVETLGGVPIRLNGDATVTVRGFGFRPQRLSVPSGTTIQWRFDDRARHDITWAEGPRGFASQYLNEGDVFATRLTEPGTYKLFCSLHPVDMSQILDVRPAAAP